MDLIHYYIIFGISGVVLFALEISIAFVMNSKLAIILFMTTAVLYSVMLGEWQRRVSPPPFDIFDDLYGNNSMKISLYCLFTTIMVWISMYIGIEKFEEYINCTTRSLTGTEPPGYEVDCGESLNRVSGLIGFSVFMVVQYYIVVFVMFRYRDPVE